MLLLSLHLLAPAASALDVDTFSFSSSAFDAQGGMQVESPTLGWPGAAYGGLGLVYAHDPLVQTFADGTTESVVTDSFATRLAFGYTLLGKVRFGLDLPLYPYVGGGPDASFNGISSGDARLRGVIGIPLGEDSPVHLAVVPMISIPTGEPSAYTGSGGVGGGLAAAAGVNFTDALGLVANVGFRANKTSTLGEQEIGSGLDLGLGGSYALTPALSVGVELDGTVDVIGGLSPWTDNPFELHAYGRYGKPSGIQAMLGLGTGLVGGVGAPDVRVIAGIGYRAAGKAPIYDIDEDGLYDDVDACVDVPEDKDGFEDSDGCPETDNDKDGIADKADGCPNEAEDIDQFEDADGCPDPDNDKDGVLDGDDECPLEPGTVGDKGCPDRDADTLIDKVDACPDEAGPVNTKGCPDRDSDRVPDKRDKCPDEPADPRIDPERSDGCPKRVFVTVDRIEILDKIYFDTNKTTIKKQSYELLAEIAAVLNGNVDIRRVEVAGHTDNVGNDASNLKLSQGRSEAVVKHLTTIGKVDPERLKGVGYGETKPIETNATDAGRGNNRRVEFVIKAFDGTFGPLGAAPVPRPVVAPSGAAETPAVPAPVVAPAPAPVVAPAPADPNDPFGLNK
jgi:outer membrane protein OmpA-like peptidoglycan-associated protein